MNSVGDDAGSDALKLKFAGSLVEQLGAQLYPSATSTVAELISNAWDADAKNVWIEIPFGASWTPQSEILVVDDGTGMTRGMAKDAYLIVGRNRRVEGGRRSEGGRKVHGRKGIGKLAAFGTAGYLECTTMRAGTLTAFGLDYDGIRKLGPGQDYEVESVDNPEPLVDPIDGTKLDHGTRIRLTRLHLTRAIPEEQFMRSMSRRFAISASEMAVFINGRALDRFDMKVEFRFPRDGAPDEASKDADGWATESITVNGEKRTVRWWIGFTPEPLDDASLQGVSVLAEKKMAQRPFKFEQTRGVEAQLGFEYLVGEVQADWLDEGEEIQDDLIQSNRDQLRLEDDRLTPFLEWGQKRVAWALRRRQQLKSEKNLTKFEASQEIEALLDRFTAKERRRYTRVAEILSKVEDASGNFVVDTMKEVVNSHDEKVIREMMEQIEAADETSQAQMWRLIHEFGLIDARRRMSIIEARLSAIGRLQRAVEGGAKEVPEVHNILLENAWLLNPRWDLLKDEQDLSRWGIEFEPSEDETGNIIDFLFGLHNLDEVVVVEIKRGTHPDGKVRKATNDEVYKFHRYVTDAETYFGRNTNPPRVRGLMIASGYTDGADRVRKKLEVDNVLEFRTWERVLAETKALHEDWLEVSGRRVDEGLANDAGATGVAGGC